MLSVVDNTANKGGRQTFPFSEDGFSFVALTCSGRDNVMASLLDEAEAENNEHVPHLSLHRRHF